MKVQILPLAFLGALAITLSACVIPETEGNSLKGHSMEGDSAMADSDMKDMAMKDMDMKDMAMKDTMMGKETLTSKSILNTMVNGCEPAVVDTDDIVLAGGGKQVLLGLDAKQASLVRTATGNIYVYCGAEMIGDGTDMFFAAGLDKTLAGIEGVPADSIVQISSQDASEICIGPFCPDSDHALPGSSTADIHDFKLTLYGPHLAVYEQITGDELAAQKDLEGIKKMAAMGDILDPAD